LSKPTMMQLTFYTFTRE